MNATHTVRLVTATAADVEAGDRILLLAGLSVLLKVTEVSPSVDPDSVILLVEGGNVVHLPRTTAVEFRR